MLRTDIAPRRPIALPDSGFGIGWEPAALAVITVSLLLFGLVNLYSASAFLAQRAGSPDTYFVLNQAVGAAAGLIILTVCANTPYTWWGRVAWPLIALTCFLLLLLILPGTEAIAPEVNGARRWLDFGIRFQPSELAKLAIVIWTAHLCVKKNDRFLSFSKGMLPFLLIWAVVIGLILLQPNLSTAFLIGVAGAMTLFAGGARIGHFVLLALLILPVGVLQMQAGFRQDRMVAFQDLSAHTSGAGYQVWQSLIAVGSGGVMGVGFGEGRQKYGFLPEPHNDFIFSMISEEWGLLGGGALILLYMGMILVGFRIAHRASDLFGQLLAVGITSLIALHTVLHIGVGLGVIPPTGLPLPLASYGRSNLLATLAAIGILISVSRGNPEARFAGRGGIG
jgi:cell division protein FtsW